MTTTQPTTAKCQLTLLDAIIVTLGYYSNELLDLHDLAWKMNYFSDSLSKTIELNPEYFRTIQNRYIALSLKGFDHLEELTAERGR